jgi:sulfide:quinone oxidoreductase
MILFMPGMTGTTWFDNTQLPRSPGGLLQADAQCRVPGFQRVDVAGDSGSFPGPDWMPKQAHMADLQARAAARNLAAELQGREPKETFKVELICIVDTNDSGMLVARTENRNIVLPAMRPFHWMKRGFEWWYLRQYR